MFRWRVARGHGVKAGDIAGHVSKAGHTEGGGYRYIGVASTLQLAHRLAWFYVHGRWPLAQLDHKDRNRDHNAIDNIREATVSQNAANRPKQANNTSGYKGVSFNKASRKWAARFQVDGKYKHLGLHDSPELAHAAYTRAHQAAFGNFARAA